MFSIERQTRNGHAVLVLKDAAAASSASILPEYGFNCFSFQVELGGVSHDLLFASETFPSANDSPSHNGTPILLPFPNRIRDGRFRYAGKQYDLPLKEQTPNAIHGFAMSCPWQVIGESWDSAAQVVGEFLLSRDRPDCLPHWPCDFRTSFTYRLQGQSLRTVISVKNLGDQMLPYGVGTHPYFRFPLSATGNKSECEIQSPAALEVELIDCLPTGAVHPVTPYSDLRTGMRLDQRSFDTVFGGLEVAEDGKIHHYLRDFDAGIEFELVHGPECPYSVIYTPGHGRAICIEPYTCVTDAINLEGGPMETGLWQLQPGEERGLTIDYHVRDIE